MENFNLPFVLRQDYETWEFELEVLDIERVPNYDSRRSKGVSQSKA
ncbi:hypothetical protein [Riemerella anatipestifer]|nr:hypothetical protein [Riemerella anatipestifer]